MDHFSSVSSWASCLPTRLSMIFFLSLIRSTSPVVPYILSIICRTKCALATAKFFWNFIIDVLFLNTFQCTFLFLSILSIFLLAIRSWSFIILDSHSFFSCSWMARRSFCYESNCFRRMVLVGAFWRRPIVYRPPTFYIYNYDTPFGLLGMGTLC